MNKGYRTEAREISKEATWTFWKFLPLFTIAMVILFAIFFGLRSAGLIGTTIVEREVFKQSFQYREGMEQRAAILQANIAEINVLLSSNPENRQNLINQKTILKSQLNAITINQ